MITCCSCKKRQVASADKLQVKAATILLLCGISLEIYSSHCVCMYKGSSTENLAGLMVDYTF